MRAEPPDNRLEVPWRKAVSTKYLFELYSLATEALDQAGKLSEKAMLRILVNQSKTPAESLKYIEQYVRFG